MNPELWPGRVRVPDSSPTKVRGRSATVATLKDVELHLEDIELQLDCYLQIGLVFCLGGATGKANAVCRMFWLLASGKGLRRELSQASDEMDVKAIHGIKPDPKT